VKESKLGGFRLLDADSALAGVESMGDDAGEAHGKGHDPMLLEKLMRKTTSLAPAPVGKLFGLVENVLVLNLFAALFIFHTSF